MVFLELVEFGALLYVVARMMIVVLVFGVIALVLLTLSITRSNRNDKRGGR
jgi:hypothetical protein